MILLSPIHSQPWNDENHLLFPAINLLFAYHTLQPRVNLFMGLAVTIQSRVAMTGISEELILVKILFWPGGQASMRRKHRLGYLEYSLNLRRRRRKASAPPHPRRNQRLMAPSRLAWPPGHGHPWHLRRTFRPPTLATHP